MDDFIWFIVIGVMFLLLGFVFIGLGWQILKKQKIDLIIHYHCDKVSEDNKAAYCALSGAGVLVIGVGFLLTGLCAAWLRSALVFLPMAVGLVAGIALLASAGIKYNH